MRIGCLLPWQTYRGALLRATLASLLIAALLTAAPARAADYGVFIDIETEEDLLDLLAANEIDETTFDILVELLIDGVNVNAADREELYALPNVSYADVDAIIDYREQAGRIDSAAALVVAGVIDEPTLLSLVPFIVIGEPAPAIGLVSGRLQYQTTYVTSDGEVPSMWLGARLRALKYLNIGLAGVLSRTRLSDVRYDPQRDALSAEAPALKPNLPKYFIELETRRWHAVAGTYRIGFGQRLTFDNTTLYNPNGIRVDDAIFTSQDLSSVCRESAGELAASPCAGAAGDEYRSPDYRWTDRLRGAAVGLKSLELGEAGWLQAYGFASYATRGIYQYEIYDRGKCDDPTSDDEACSAPLVFRRQDDPLTPTSRFSYSTLPDMYDELTAGGNVSYFHDRRTHIGVTGYGADVDWLVDGIDLDFQEWSRLPYGGPFGAVGLDAAYGVDLLDLFAEVARSLDSQPEGGGWAALLRGTLTFDHHELELLGRYYGRDFANPHARPLSAADEFDGLRARDEAGGRVRYTGDIGDLQLRGAVDLWAQLSERLPKLRFTARGDYRVAKWFRPGLRFEYQDKDLSDTGRGNCYEVPDDETPEGEPIPCSGEKLQAALELKFWPFSRLAVSALYQHRWIDDGSSRYDSKFRQDLSTWLMVMYKPIDELRLRVRLRYLHEGMTNNDYLEQSVWFYAEASYWIQQTFRIKLRYELYDWLDARSSTEDRDPNPAHWLRAELEFVF